MRSQARTFAVDREPVPSMTRADFLTVRRLTCSRGGRLLLTDFDLDLAPGELVWLRAANGFGKTSLLRVLAGLSKPDAGTLAWSADARPRVAGGKFDSREVGGAKAGRVPLLYLAHANALKDDLTVLESVQHLVRLHGLDASAATIADAIRRVGLHGRRHAPVRTLSQGQRRRVALTRLCLSPPDATWLLDEPCDALDADGVALVGDLLAAHGRAGGSALFTSHVAPSLENATLRTVQLDPEMA